MVSAQDDSPAPDSLTTRTTRSGRTVVAKYVESDDEEDEAPRPPGKRRSARNAGRETRAGNGDGFIASEDDDNAILDSDDAPFGSHRRRRQPSAPAQPKTRSARDKKRKSSKRPRLGDEDDEFELSGDGGSTDGDGSIDLSDSPEPEPALSPPTQRRVPRDELSPPRSYGLRPARRPVNYQIPPPLENDASLAALAAASERSPRPRARTGFARNPSHLNFDNLGTLPPLPPLLDDSDSDNPDAPANRAAANALNAPGGQGLIGAGGASGPDVATASGGPANYGKVSKDSLLSDSDPLGVNVNVTFDEVGGLDDHISSLKEMVTLPLLYPEIFQQFKITPPRGVLFHGPPGTGKTLLARALAASARSGGREVAFFMRKGADILSKWVGEAERQLRLLFEEAKNCQPSIIFFDEIDGLAPVRSSKQDQIHASIVSTLLALMDGMDGRGQVIVIGATNRPDAVDPALRRPGRFDREFYFPLPDLKGRKKILGIMTRGWPGWEGEEGEKTLEVIAEATKGYGGADLRALATEATLNAIQRTYPQIYKSSDRLLVQPDTIRVLPRDFMLSVRKIVASSARSTASAASPLPSHMIPLLQPTLDNVRTALDKLIPKNKVRNALEEAEFEDAIEGDDGYRRETLLQAMESQRVFRPRLLIHGSRRMGQGLISAAALHHLEGMHLQSLDLGTLFGDPARTSEAALVQLFVEAKRRKPSIIYIPSLLSWCAALSETAKNAMREMLDSIPSTDSVLLLGVVQGDLDEIPPDVRDWFGYAPENAVAVQEPSLSQRMEFFAGILEDLRRPPNQFPDAFPRRKRILPVLPVAPPLPPKAPSPAQLAAQAEKDHMLLVALSARLGPILNEFKKKYRRVTRTVQDAKDVALLYDAPPPPPVEPVVDPLAMPNGALGVITEPTIDVEMADGAQSLAALAFPPPTAVPEHPLSNGVSHPSLPTPVNGTLEVPIISGPAPTNEPALSTDPNHAILATAPAPVVQVPIISEPAAPTIPKKKPRVHDVDLDKMQGKLYDPATQYLTPAEVQNDLGRIVHNTSIEPCNRDHVLKAHQMYTEFASITWDQQYVAEWERMSVRIKAKRVADRVAALEKQKELAQTLGLGVPASSDVGTGIASSQALPLPPLPTIAEEPEATTSQPSQSSDRHLKRSRDEEMADSEPGGSGASTSKRLRVADLISDDADAFGSSSAPSPAAAPSTEPTQPTRPRSPTPILPDFILDERQILALQNQLSHTTNSLTIEQLEELRSILLDCVWRKRADWDRTEMLESVHSAITHFVQRPDVARAREM